MKAQTLPLFFWLIVPILFIVAQIVIELVVPPESLGALHSEGGPHEVLQTIFSSLSFLLALHLLALVDWTSQRLVGFMLGVVALGSLYIAGEEISWGQHILNWNTPSYWSQFNDQNETNLHNTSAWLDQKPRLLLFIGIVIGGLVIPALRRWKPDTLPLAFAFFYPSVVVVPCALGVLLPYLGEAVAEAAGTKLFERVSEVQELYMYYFVLIYLLDLRKRLFFSN